MCEKICWTCGHYAFGCFVTGEYNNAIRAEDTCDKWCPESKKEECIMKSIVLDTFVESKEVANCRMPMIVIYDKPLDHPYYFVGRLFDLDTPTCWLVKALTLTEIIEKVPSHFTRINRHPADDKKIVCTYL